MNNYRNTALLLGAIISAAEEANALRGASGDRRQLFGLQMPICHKESSTSHVTEELSMFQFWLRLLFTEDVPGSCSEACDSLCADFPSFEAIGTSCQCIEQLQVEQDETIETEQIVAAPVPTCINPFGNPCGPGSVCSDTETGFVCTPLPNEASCPIGCGPNASCVDSGTDAGFNCECDDGFYRPDENSTCREEPLVVEEDETVPTTESVDDTPIVMCANPFGNPCGPGSACTDSDTGIVCSPLPNYASCPLGCSPNESCIDGNDGSGFQCQCDDGYVRETQFSSCVPSAE